MSVQWYSCSVRFYIMVYWVVSKFVHVACMAYALRVFCSGSCLAVFWWRCCPAFALCLAVSSPLFCSLRPCSRSFSRFGHLAPPPVTFNCCALRIFESRSLVQVFSPSLTVLSPVRCLRLLFLELQCLGADRAFARFCPLALFLELQCLGADRAFARFCPLAV